MAGEVGCAATARVKRVARVPAGHALSRHGGGDLPSADAEIWDGMIHAAIEDKAISDF